jgi:hypothetical protein
MYNFIRLTPGEKPPKPISTFLRRKKTLDPTGNLSASK